MNMFRHEESAYGLRVPPHSNDAEQSVLGGLMLSPDSLDKIAHLLAEDDFYRRDHRIIWRAVTALANKGIPCDAITLGEWFQANDLSDIMGGPAYLLELANGTPSAANIGAYAQVVRDHSIRRRVIDVGTRLIEDGFQGHAEPGQLIDSGIGELMGMQRVDTTSEYTLQQALLAAYEAADQARKRGGRIPGIATGLTDLDELLGGWHNSDLIVIGARPAMGKTALLLNMALSAFREGPIDAHGHPTRIAIPAGLISTEQPVVQLGARLLALEGRVKASRLRNGAYDDEDLGRMSAAVARLIERELMINDRATVNIGDVKRTARRWRHQHGIAILWVDYLQRIHGNDLRAPKHEQVAEVASGLKDIGRELDIPVVSLGQVSREVEKRLKDKRPNMGDLSDSSAVEKEADIIAMLYRDEVYNPDTPDKGRAELNIEKNRHGPTGTIDMAWFPDTMKFSDWRPGTYFDE